MYDAVLANKLTMLGSFNIMKRMVRYRLRKVKLTDAEIDGEAWRILSGQKYYKIKERKDIHEKLYKGIRVAVLTLNEKTMPEKYNSKRVPILSKEGPLSLKLIRDSHTGDTPFHKLYKTINSCIRMLTKGRFGVLFPGAKTYLRLIKNNCVRCTEQDGFTYEQELGDVCTRMNNTFNHPFQQSVLIHWDLLKSKPLLGGVKQ